MLPVPRTTWLQVVLRADAAYGFDGDSEPLTAAILRGKMASLYEYSLSLRKDAVAALSTLDVANESFVPSAYPFSEARVPGPVEDLEVPEESSVVTGDSEVEESPVVPGV